MKFFERTFLCMALCFAFCVSANDVQGQILYTVTGIANNFGPGTSIALDLEANTLSPDVAADESYVAEFLIDSSVSDSNSDTGIGQYTGAILNGSIEFSGGYTSMVDYQGGNVLIQQDNGGGGVFLSDTNGENTLLLADIGSPFASDALLTSSGTEIVSGPFSLWSIQEPSGTIFSFSEVGFDAQESRAIKLKVSAAAVPEPSTAALLGFGLLSLVARRRR